MKEQTQNCIVTTKIAVNPKYAQMALLAEAKIPWLLYVWKT